MTARTLCSNPRHPNGPWHEATPVPFRPGLLAAFTRQGRQQRREERAYDKRRALWGCGCRAMAAA